MMFLQLILCIIFLANKILVLIGKEKKGWALGIIGSLGGIYYFHAIDLDIFMVLQVGSIVLMVRGIVQNKSKALECIIYATTIIVMCVLGYSTLNGSLKITEFISSIVFLFGILALTHNKRKIGWLLYTIAHILTVCIVWNKPNQEILTVFQIISAVLSLFGIFTFKNTQRAVV